MTSAQISPPDSGSALASAVEVISRRLDGWRRLAPGLRRADPAAVGALLDEMAEAVETLNGAAGLTTEAARLVRNTALHGGFPLLLLVRGGEADAASRRLVRLWTQTLQDLGWDSRVAAPAAEVAEPPRPASGDGEGAELLPLFNVALFRRLSEEESQERDRRSLARLGEVLHLSFDQLGRMLGVSGETVRRWTQGSHRVPEGRSAEIARAAAALGRLLEIFQPQRLFQVVRRRVDLFAGESALDWILRGKIAEVADRYELALSYQG